MLLNHHKVKLCIPTAKILEVMTTKKCLQNFHLESLENLDDSFLRYAISIQSFKTYENYHEGLLNIKKNKIISNVALFKLGCARKIMRFNHSISKCGQFLVIILKNFLMPSVEMCCRVKYRRL